MAAVVYENSRFVRSIAVVLAHWITRNVVQIAYILLKHCNETYQGTVHPTVHVKQRSHLNNMRRFITVVLCSGADVMWEGVP